MISKKIGNNCQVSIVNLIAIGKAPNLVFFLSFLLVLHSDIGSKNCKKIFARFYIVKVSRGEGGGGDD